jgi:hypothetical protein
MFDRFKKNRADDGGVADGRTAVADRPVAASAATTQASTAPPTRAADERPIDEELDQRDARGHDTRDGVTADDRTAVRDDGRRDDHGHSTRNAALAGGAGLAAGEVAGRHHERKEERKALRRDERDGVVDERDGVRRHAPLMEGEAMASVRRRQRAEFGGVSWGSAFFGWLCAVGLAAILTSILVAAGAAIGLNQVKNAANNDTNTIGLAGGIALLVVLAIAWYAGGYVAGRMARFDGARQGFAVWIWTLVFIALAAVAAVIGGTQYDIANQLNLPSIPTGNQTLTTGGAIAAGAALLVTLLFAVIGGKAGDRFHRRVDRVATDEYHEVV